MSTFYAPTSELYHYGRLGMKWGEHRFAKDASKQLKASAKKSARLWGAAEDYLDNTARLSVKKQRAESKLAGDGSKRDLKLKRKIEKLEEKVSASKDRTFDLMDKFSASREEGEKIAKKIMSTPGFKDKYVTSIHRGSVTRDPYMKDIKEYKRTTGKNPKLRPSGSVKTVEYDYKKVRRNTKLNRVLARGNQYERGYRRVNTTYAVIPM